LLSYANLAHFPLFRSPSDIHPAEGLREAIHTTQCEAAELRYSRHVPGMEA